MTRHDSNAVAGILARLVAENPDRVDVRAKELAPRYVQHGHPNCLVAVLLDRMKVSLGVLKMLDVETRGTGGVILWDTRHAIRKRFTPAAWELLAALQFCNDQGWTWACARRNVFSETAWIGRRWNRDNVGRPWLDEIDGS